MARSWRWCLAAIALSALGCGDGSAAPEESAAPSISGRVTGLGYAGVRIDLAGDAVATTTTDGSGRFSFHDLAVGGYTVVPAQPGLVFSPPVRDVIVEGAGTQSASFDAASDCVHGRLCLAGTIRYDGPRRGRIYVSVHTDDGREPDHAFSPWGVSLSEPGPFLIRGLRPGAYFVDAYLDIVGSGERNDPSPHGRSGSFELSQQSGGGVDIELVDPAPVPLQPPTRLIVYPIDGGAIVDWVGDESKFEGAESYNVYWSTQPDVGPGKTVGGGSVQGLPARRSENFWVNTELTNGETYYFVMEPQVGDSPGPLSEVFGPLTITPPTGGHEVVGRVHFGGQELTGPLVISTINQKVEQVWHIDYAPTDPTPFAMRGMDAGAWEIVASVDQDNDGLIWKGDPTFCFRDGELAPFFELGLGPVDLDLVLYTPSSYQQLTTVHTLSHEGDSYEVQLHVRQGLKLPVQVTLQSHGLEPGPIDVQGRQVYWVHGRVTGYVAEYGPERPSPDDRYAFTIEYDDGTTETVVKSPTVIDWFAEPLHPIGNVAGDLVPTFRWTAPAPAPELPYTYRVLLEWGEQNLWTPPVIPQDTTEVAYNFERYETIRHPGGFGPPLVGGHNYTWSLEVRDFAGNRSRVETRFSP